MTWNFSRACERATSRDLAWCPAPGIWMAAVCLLALGAVWIAVAGVRLQLVDFALVTGVFLGLFGVAAAYAASRRADAIATACFVAAFLILFNLAAGILSYAGMWLGAPLQDGWFAGVDAALGFDWLAHLAFVAQRPALAQALTWAYFSCTAQLFALVCILSLVDRSALARFVSLYATTVLVTICIATVFPTVGAVAHHAPPADLLAALPDALSGSWHMADLTALRQGSFRELSPRALEGLISFPSFHTALGVLFIHAFARAPGLLAPAVVLNLAMILSTLSVGGHYLADVIAGGAIAGASILALQRWEVRGLRSRTPTCESAAA